MIVGNFDLELTHDGNHQIAYITNLDLDVVPMKRKRILQFHLSNCFPSTREILELIGSELILNADGSAVVAGPHLEGKVVEDFAGREHS